MKNIANDIDARFHEALKDMGYKVKPLAGKEVQVA